MKLHKLVVVYTLIFACLMYIGIPTKIVQAHEIDDTSGGFNVLVLNSHHQGSNWELNILDGLTNTLEVDKNNNINLKVEYLDFENNNNEKYIESFKKMLKIKYVKGSIDAIYAIGDEAYNTLKEEIIDENSSFYHIPLLFSGGNNKMDLTNEQKEYTMGVYNRDDVADLLNLIKRLNPKTKNINLITEKSKYGESIKKQIDESIKTCFDYPVKINYIKSDYIEVIDEELDNIKSDKNTVNIISGQFKSKNTEKFMDAKSIIDIINVHSKSPIYSNDQTYMKAGILGGYIDIGQEHGKIIAKMLIEIKNDENLNFITDKIEPKANEYIDYQSVYKYNINPYNINKDAKILNKKFYEALIPTWMKSLALVVIGLTVLFIVILCYYLNEFKKERIIEKKEKEKAKEREQLKTDFIMNLSHELRTPINIILSTSKFLQYNLEKDIINVENIYKKLYNINQNSYRLLKISNNIIDITKAESGMLEPKLENCNIVEVIEDIFTSVIDFAKRKNISMLFDTSEEELIISIDKFQIQRVILNLLSNAIKFTNQDGNISLIISKRYKYVVIEVRDNGCGIPNEKLNYIFDRFYQVDNLMTRKSEGSGIGLCISKEIIDIHDGEIEVESEVGKGSVFKIYLPIRTVDKDIKFDNDKILELNSIVDLEMSDI